MKAFHALFLSTAIAILTVAVTPLGASAAEERPSIDALLHELDRYSPANPQYIGIDDMQVAPGDGLSLRQMDERSRLIGELAMRIYREFPDDPRRWEAALQLIRSVNGRSYIESVAPGYDAELEKQMKGDRTAQPDRYLKYRTDRDKLKDEARQSVAAIYRHLLVARDIAGEVQEQGMITAMMSLGYESAEDLRALLNRFPQSRSRNLAVLTERVYTGLKRNDAKATEQFIQWARQSPNALVAAHAEGIARTERLSSTPMRMNFTAVDGRKVDLEKLRGKVVLIDFWATWCGPCVAGLPAIKQVYERYRAQGLEVIGIPLEAAKDRQKLIDFCNERGLSWPQHFDGRKTQNEYAVEYGVISIPTLFLLDKTGRLAVMNPAKEALEPQVRRLLGL